MVRGRKGFWLSQQHPPKFDKACIIGVRLLNFTLHTIEHKHRKTLFDIRTHVSKLDGQDHSLCRVPPRRNHSAPSALSLNAAQAGVRPSYGPV